MIKRMSFILSFTLFLMALGGCGNSESVSTPISNENSSSTNDSQFVEYGVAGNIMEITDSEDENVLGVIKIEGPENNGATYKNALVAVRADTKVFGNNPSDFDQLEVGMYVEVFFTEDVKETHPVQATARQINIIPPEAQ